MSTGISGSALVSPFLPTSSSQSASAFSSSSQSAPSTNALAGTAFSSAASSSSQTVSSLSALVSTAFSSSVSSSNQSAASTSALAHATFSSSFSSSSQAVSSLVVLPSGKFRPGFLRWWNVSTINYLSAGGHGSVYHAEDENRIPVVLKRNNTINPDIDAGDLWAIVDERSNLSLLAQERIAAGVPELLDWFPFSTQIPKLDEQTLTKLKNLGFNEKSYVIVTPYAGCQLHSLFYLGYDVTHVRYFAEQQLRTIGVLRKAHITHGDVKPQNYAFTRDNCTITLLDFASLTRNDAPPPHKPTLWYRAPEYFLDFDKSQGDIWSLACIFYEFGSGGRPLFPASSGYEEEQLLLGLICKEIGLPKVVYATKSKLFHRFFTFGSARGLEVKCLSRALPLIPELHRKLTKSVGFSSNEALAFTDLILSMLKYIERPEPEELLNHPFFTKNYAASPPVKK